MGWVSIKESGYPCPKDKSAWVLVYADGAVNCMAYSEGLWKDWTKSQCHNIVVQDITHWMPLPENPSE